MFSIYVLRDGNKPAVKSWPKFAFSEFLADAKHKSMQRACRAEIEFVAVQEIMTKLDSQIAVRYLCW